MSKLKSTPIKPTYVPPSQVVWTTERLATLDKVQLANLLDNLQTQRASGRVSEQIATELEVSIRARLPARSTTARRKRSVSDLRIETQAAERLTWLATDLERRYDLSPETATSASAGIKGFRLHAMLDPKGRPRSGACVKTGTAIIHRYVGYRSRDSFAGLAFVLLPEREPQNGSFLVIGTDDLLEADTLPGTHGDIVGQHGWSTASRGRMRGRVVSDFNEGAQSCEALIARIAMPVRDGTGGANAAVEDATAEK